MNAMSSNMKYKPLSIRGLWLAAIICIAIVAGTFVTAVSYIAFALGVLAIVLLPEEDALSSMMLIMPFANIFKSSPQAQSFFTYLLLIYVIWNFCKRCFIHKVFLFSLALFVVYLIAQMAFSIDILRMIKFLANILFVYLGINSKRIHNTKKIFLAFILGVVITSLIAVMNIIPNLYRYIGWNIATMQQGRVLRFAGMYGDPNYYCVSVTIALCLIVILNHRKELSNVISICLAALFVFFVAMTMSKSGFLMLILPVILLLYSRGKKRNYFDFILVALAIIVIASQLFSGNISIFNDVMNRIEGSDNLSALTTGRLRIWANYLNYFVQNPGSLLFGRGFGANLLDGQATHNTYIELLYHLGAVGTFLLGLVFSALLNNKGSKKASLLNRSIWICIAVMYFFLSEMFYFDMAFHLLIATLVSRMNTNLISEP